MKARKILALAMAALLEVSSIAGSGFEAQAGDLAGGVNVETEPAEEDDGTEAAGDADENTEQAVTETAADGAALLNAEEQYDGSDDEDGAEAVPVEAAVEEAVLSEADAEQAEAAGLITEPIEIEFGKKYRQGTEGQYYKCSPAKKGSLEIFTVAETGGIKLSIYEGSATASNLFFFCENESEQLSSKGKIGLRDGIDYIVYVEGSLYNAENLSFTLSFTPDEYWEEEVDSPQHIKAIKTDTGKNYHGYLSKEDPKDYYSFTLPKASKVTIWEKGAEWLHHLKIYTDSSFSESDMIHDDVLSSSGENIYEGELAAGTYYLLFESFSPVWASDYEFAVKTSAGASSSKKYPATGSATVNGESVSSLKEAFSKMTDENEDYVVELASDMGSSDSSYEKNLVIPKTANSVTIKGNRYTVTIVGTKLTANAKLKLENVKIKTMTAKGLDAAFTLTAKKDLNINEDVSFLSTKQKTVNCSTILSLTGSLDVNKLTTASLDMGPAAILVAGSKAEITVKSKLSGESGARIQLKEGFKPLTIKGEIADGSAFELNYADADGKEAKLKDAAQLLTVNKKRTNDELACFDVSALGGDTEGAEYALVKPAATKAALYPLAFSYNNKNYALWKDLIADAAAAGGDISVELNSDAYTYGALKLPKANKYISITIDGNGHMLSFTGDVKLSAPATLKDVSLHGQTAKGADKSYKITETPKKGYTLTKEGTVDAGNIKLPNS